MNLKHLILAVAAVGGLFTAVTPAFAQWTPTGAPNENWTALASSSDGAKLVAVAGAPYGSSSIYTSSDSGATWTQTSAPAKAWNAVASSADGTKLAAAAYYSYGPYGPIYTSQDSGATWTVSTAPGEQWSSLASSADGVKLVATAYDDGSYAHGPIYTSTNSGATWTKTSAPDRLWNAVSSSADGTKLVAVAGYYYGGSPIYVSTNSGVTWTETEPYYSYWTAVAASADGLKVVAADHYGYVYTSTNSGSTWTLSSIPGSLPWSALASSADGTRLVVVAAGGVRGGTDYGNGSIYTSGDAGATWVQNDAPNTNWFCVASSADGNKLVAAVYGGSIYTAHFTRPVIASQPTNQTVLAGTSVTLAVGVVGAAPLAFQWNINGTNLLYATNASLTFTNARLSDSGTYTVLVTNSFAIVLSSNAVLAVEPALAITWPATGITMTNADLSGVVTPGANDTLAWFQWGLDTNYGNETPVVDIGQGFYEKGISSVAMGLTPGTIYHFRVVAVNALGMAVSDDATFVTAGAPFIQTSAPATNWISVASSADGTKLVAAAGGDFYGKNGSIYTSSDSGATWTLTTAPSVDWACVASSADGTQLVAVTFKFTALGEGTIYTSADSGATWNISSTASEYWASVASSADGRKLVAVAATDPSVVYGPIYTSTDYGATWNQASAPSGTWTSVASSADGNKLVVVGNGSFPNHVGVIYVSANSGVSWTQTSAPALDWTFVASSADGTKLVALWGGSPIYISTNSGSTWTTTSTPDADSRSVAFSADGSRLVLAGLELYTSTDLGANWTPHGGFYGASVASSADGNKLVAVAYWGIYTLQAAGPVIFTQPVSETVPAGVEVTFGVGVSGAPPLNFQWTSNSVVLPGATNANLTISDVTLAESGSQFAVLVTNALGSAWSSNAGLTVVPAIATTTAANLFALTGEILNGLVTVESESVLWFEWGTDTNYGNVTGVELVPGDRGTQTITNALSGINAGDVYHYRLVVANDSGIVYGNDQSFVAGLVPTVVTLPATGISTNGATLNATINPNGPDTTVYFRWGTTSYYDHTTATADLGKGTAPASFSAFVSGLNPGIYYHYQIIASNILGQANGADVSFLTGPWVLTTAPASVGWQSIASSADGNKLVAAGIFTSTNGGSTWQSNNVTNAKWTTVASSADGITLVAAQGGYQAYGLIYTSTNGGVTWATNNAPTLNWRSVAASADGMKMVAVSGYEGRIYTSTNAGSTWISNAAPIQPWNSVASSADGTKLVAVAYQGRIGVSANSGASWTLTNAPYGYWWSVASSADGSKLVAAQGGYPYGGYAGPIYVSTNAGATWTQTSAPFVPWFSVASSADGTKLAAAVSGAYGSSGPIYISTNSGATWTPSGAPYAGWTSIASSADGNKLAAACYAVNTGIYTLQTTPTPLLSLSPSSGNALLSWTIPSLDFALQQNSDLTTTNWTDVTAAPVLNLTNLQNQVIVSPTNANAFFRLKH